MAVRGRAFFSEQTDDSRIRYYKGGLAEGLTHPADYLLLLVGFALYGRIAQRSLRAASCRRRHAGGFDLLRPEYMHHRLAGREQIIGDDAAMTAPPHDFRAHHGARPLSPDLAQLRKTRLELRAHRVIRIVVEACVLPERVHVRRDRRLAA